MAIKLSNINKHYGKQRVLHNVSFQTSSNKIIGFLGPNGAGKSTTMKIITGVLPYESGNCVVNGLSPTTSPLQLKKSIGYLPENNPLYLDMYVWEALKLECRVHKLDNIKQRIQDVILITGLESVQHKTINQLSKGFRQRVGLALAIVHDPQVLVLDEPTSGLDPNQILEIRNLIKRLGKKKTIFLSTHLMQEAEAICDEIIVLHKGEIKDQFYLQDLKKLYPDLSLEEVFVILTK